MHVEDVWRCLTWWERALKAALPARCWLALDNRLERRYRLALLSPATPTRPEEGAER